MSDTVNTEGHEAEIDRKAALMFQKLRETAAKLSEATQAQIELMAATADLFGMPTDEFDAIVAEARADKGTAKRGLLGRFGARKPR